MKLSKTQFRKVWLKNKTEHLDYCFFPVTRVLKRNTVEDKWVRISLGKEVVAEYKFKGHEQILCSINLYRKWIEGFKYSLRRTSRQQIQAALRTLWMRSRERGYTLSRDQRTCQHCGVKASKAKGKEQKVVVHHKEMEVNWDKLVDILQEMLLCDPDGLEVLCPECHTKIHGREAPQ